MSESSSREYHRPLTQAEQVCEEVGNWYVIRNPDSRRSPKKTHVPDLDADELATLCRAETRGYYSDAQVLEKDWAVIPLDHYPMCQKCENLLDKMGGF